VLVVSVVPVSVAAPVIAAVEGSRDRCSQTAKHQSRPCHPRARTVKGEDAHCPRESDEIDIHISIIRELLGVPLVLIRYFDLVISLCQA